MTRYLNPWNIIGGAVSLALIWYMFTKMVPTGISLNGSLLLFIGIAAACAIVVGGEFLITKWTLTGAAVNVARGVSILFGCFIALFTVVSIWSWGVPQGLPSFGWMGQIMLHIWQIVIWMTAACIVYAIGEAVIRKTVPVGTGRAIARIVIAILALTFASAVTASTVNQGLWSFGWGGSAYQTVTQSWSTSIVAVTGALLLIMAVYGAYRDAKTAGDKLAILAWRVLFAILIVVTGLIIFGGEDSVLQIVTVARHGFRGLLAQVLAGDEKAMKDAALILVIIFSVILALVGLVKVRIIWITATSIFAVIALCLLVWLVWSSLSPHFPAMQVVEDKIGVVVTTGKLTTPAEEAAAFAAQLEETKRAGEILAAQRVAEAAAQAITAAANAKAAEVARLTEEVSKNLPTSIKVPRCAMDKDGEHVIDSMSQVVEIPARWGVMAAWGVGSTPFAIRKDGEWTIATNIDNSGVEAVRYCTTSQANADSGTMSLSWYAN